ncbi:MAG: branched-chain amino acid transaminase [Vicinamibacterales bacterium]
MEPLIYFNRAFRPEREATISVRSRALNYGLGCFAGIRGYKTDDNTQVHVFRLDRHVRRLEHSARILRLALSGTPVEIAAIIIELLRRNDMRGDVYIRPIVFANSNELSPLLDPDTSETAIFCMPMGRYLSAGPIDVCVSSWCRVRENAIPARAKATGAYLNSALARREAIDNGYTEAILLTDEGHVSEGSAEHVFIVRDGQLVSPPSTADNLDGITRHSLITLAREDLDLPFVERPIGRTELYVADEVFLCGTGAEVTPVRSVDRRVVGDGQVGPITRRLSEHFEAVVRGRVARRMDWLTPVW